MLTAKTEAVLPHRNFMLTPFHSRMSTAPGSSLRSGASLSGRRACAAAATRWNRWRVAGLSPPSTLLNSVGDRPHQQVAAEPSRGLAPIHSSPARFQLRNIERLERGD